MGHAAKRFNRKRRRRMMRVIRLDGSEDAKRAFVQLFTAVRSQPVEGIEQIRRVGKIMDKLEAVAISSGEGEQQGWQLAPDGGDIWLESAEFNEVRSRMIATKWAPDHARALAKTFDLLDSAPEEDPSKPRIVADGAAEG
jgi:hypothetical protein